LVKLGAIKQGDFDQWGHFTPPLTQYSMKYSIEYNLQESPANAKVSARQPCWSKTDFDVK